MKAMIVVRVDRCLGCKSCELACAVRHSVSGDLLKAMDEKKKPRAGLTVRQGAGFVAPLLCRHCEDAPCAEVCPTKALSRANRESPVLLDEERCVGCKYCVLACPFGVIRLEGEGRAMVKCDQCFERVEKGQLPACVSACKTGALEYRSIDEVLESKEEAYLVQIRRASDGSKK